MGAPGVYKIQPGDSLRAVIRRAGGVTPQAYLFATQLTRESVRVEQMRILQQSTATMAVPDAAQGQAMAQVQNALATGRIVLQMKPSATSIDDYPEIVLEDGDKVLIPPQVKTVNVGGAIYNQSAYLYHSGMRVEDYLRLAGNGTRVADLKHLIVVRADGSILGRPPGGLWKGNLKTVGVIPGDTIVVPAKVTSGMGGIYQELGDLDANCRSIGNYGSRSWGGHRALKVGETGVERIAQGWTVFSVST